MPVANNLAATRAVFAAFLVPLELRRNEILYLIREQVPPVVRLVRCTLRATCRSISSADAFKAANDVLPK